MPIVKISLLNNWNDEDKKMISNLIHESLVEAFKIPDDDYNHQVLVFDKSNFIYSKYKTNKFILIEMNIFPGRSRQAKNTLYEIITAKLNKLGISKSDILIILNEPPLENWGFMGKSANEVNIGFNLNV